MSQYTFLLRSPRDLLDKASRELGRMRSFASTGEIEAEADHAFNLAITLWHIADWVWASPQPAAKTALRGIGCSTWQQFKDYLYQSRVELEICEEIANGSKHFEITRKANASKLVGAATVSAPGPTVQGPSHPVLKIALVDGRRVRAIDVFKPALNFWKKFFVNHGL